MPNPASVSPQILLSKVKDVARRFMTSGPRSAWVGIRVNADNYRVRYATSHGSKQFACPCCGWEGGGFYSLDCHRFAVPGVFCPHCGCQERHRFLDLLFKRKPPAFGSGEGSVLVFAADPQIRSYLAGNPRLRVACTDYADIYHGLTFLKIPEPRFLSDMHNIPAPSNTFDGLFCLHVLEHVNDDRRCIGELHRVLKPGGVAVIMVPFMMDQSATIEYGAPDPNLFGHVRGYAIHDFKHRLAPFHYEEIFPGVIMTPQEQIRHSIRDDQVIYLCTKKA